MTESQRHGIDFSDDLVDMLFEPEDLNFSMLYPKDESAGTSTSNPTLQHPIEIPVQNYVQNQEELFEFNPEEIETCLALDSIFDFSHLSPNHSKTGDDGSSRLSLASNDIFVGSESDLEEVLFNDLPEANVHQKFYGTPCSSSDEDRLVIVEDTPKVNAGTYQSEMQIDNATNQVEMLVINTPKQTEMVVVNTPKQAEMQIVNLMSEKLKKTHVSDLTSAHNSPVQIINLTSPLPENIRPLQPKPSSRRQLTYNEATVHLPKKDKMPQRCDGCNKMFKKIQQHKCKSLTKSVSDPNQTPSSSSKFYCKTCHRSFRSENQFRNHLTTHLNKLPLSRPLPMCAKSKK